MSSQDHIGIFELEIPDRCIRQIELDGLPAVPSVEGDVDAMLRAEKQEPLFQGIFPDCAGKVTIRNTVHNLCPGFAVILCAPDIRCPVVYLVPVCSHIGGAWCVGRFFNDRDSRELWHIGRGDLCPGVTAVPGDVHQSVI